MNAAVKAAMDRFATGEQLAAWWIKLGCFRCVGCWNIFFHPNRLQLDHDKSKACNGSDAAYNRQPLCPPCNGSKNGGKHGKTLNELRARNVLLRLCAPNYPREWDDLPMTGYKSQPKLPGLYREVARLIDKHGRDPVCSGCPLDPGGVIYALSCYTPKFCGDRPFDPVFGGGDGEGVIFCSWCSHSQHRHDSVWHGDAAPEIMRQAASRRFPDLEATPGIIPEEDIYMGDVKALLKSGVPRSELHRQYQAGELKRMTLGEAGVCTQRPDSSPPPALSEFGL